VNDLVQRHLETAYTAHFLHASFVTVAVEAGQSNKAIKNQTKQKTNVMIERYARLDDVKDSMPLSTSGYNTQRIGGSPRLLITPSR